MFSCRVFLFTIIALMLPFAHTTCDQLVASVNQYCEAQRNATDIAINTTIEKMFQEQTEAMMTAIEEKVKQRSLQLTGRSEERYQEIKREQTKSMMIAIEEKVKQRSQQLIERSEARYRELEQELQELRRQQEIPEGWYKAGNGLLYQFSNSQKNWYQANAYCRSRGAILVSSGIRNSATRREIIALAGKVWFWLGLTDMAREGHWSWEDGISASTSDPIWRSGEPNDSQGGEDCARFIQQFGTWFANDVGCELTNAAIICEKRP